MVGFVLRRMLIATLEHSEYRLGLEQRPVIPRRWIFALIISLIVFFSALIVLGAEAQAKPAGGDGGGDGGGGGSTGSTGSTDKGGSGGGGGGDSTTKPSSGDGGGGGGGGGDSTTKPSSGDGGGSADKSG